MNPIQQHSTDFSSERFARLHRMMASFDSELRQRSTDRESDDAGASDVIEEPCRLAPGVLRRRRTHQ